MKVQLYDLAGADIERRFSPYCWRTKMALAHKGIEFETIPWHFTDKDKIAFSGQGRVPVLIDGDTFVFDSWTIATYLEDKYTDRPSLFDGPGARAATLFVNAWADTVLAGGIARLIVTDILSHVAEKDRAYFRKSREERFGGQLEAIVADRDTRVGAFRASLEPVRTVLRQQSYLAGSTPAYIDYVVFGCFQWARCISSFALLEQSDPIWEWRNKLLDAHGGLAKKAIGYPV